MVQGCSLQLWRVERVRAMVCRRLLLYHMQRASGAMDQIGSGLRGLTTDVDLQVLVLVIGLSSFVEAICGFGVGIVVIAPLLLSLGLDPLRVTLLSSVERVRSLIQDLRQESAMMTATLQRTLVTYERS